MAEKSIDGISGVLGELISPAPTPAEAPPKKQPPAVRQRADPANASNTPAAPRPQRARLGRPPGSDMRHTGPKEKVTLRIPSDLIAEYRDWSWEARCQLSELVERALLSYRNSRRRP